MQHDEVIWQVINQNFCSYKAKTVQQNFCRNEYNLTGLCNRSSCPLANSQYATILEKEGQVYLYMKTIERAHTPKNMWERVLLPKNYMQSLEKIDKELEYWPKFQIHKAKQRLTKIHQYLVRARRIQLKVKPKLVGVSKKIERREAKREIKAEAAATLDKSIEKELLERLHAGTYGDIYNFPQKNYDKVLDGEDAEADEDMDEGEEADEEEEEEDEGEYEHEFVEEYLDDLSDIEDDAEELGAMGAGDEDDDEAEERPNKKRRKSHQGRKAKVEIEYENEMEPEGADMMTNW